MAADSSPQGPYKLVTVNTAPERAQRLIGQLVDALKDSYTIKHVANCESEATVPYWKVHVVDKRLEIDEVESSVQKHKPDLLVPSPAMTPAPPDRY